MSDTQAAEELEKMRRQYPEFKDLFNHPKERKDRVSKYMEALTLASQEDIIVACRRVLYKRKES